MPDQDPLAGRFAAFREASIAAAQPPGITAVRHTLARRRAGRTLAAASVLAVVLLTGAVLWFVRPGQLPRPAGSATAAPSAAASATPTPGGQSTPSTSASPSPSLAQTSKVPVPKASPCTPFAPNGLLELMVNESNQLYVAPSDYFSRCPEARIRVYGALYEWDRDGQQYTLAHTDNAYLTAASPTAPLPTIDPASLPGCGYAFIVAQSNVNPPSFYPTSLTGAPDNIDSYWAQHNLGHIVSWLANTYTPAEQAKSVGCQPPGGPTAGPTP